MKPLLILERAVWSKIFLACCQLLGENEPLRKEIAELKEWKKAVEKDHEHIEEIKKQMNKYKTEAEMNRRLQIRTLEVIAEASDDETLRKKSEAAKRLLRHFKKETRTETKKEGEPLVRLLRKAKRKS